MCPPAASPINFVDILDGSDKGICMSLQRITNGAPLPSNVSADVNPYQYWPSDLPDGLWYLITSKAEKDVGFGYWRTKGEACQIFANSSCTCWRSILEFFDGREPLGKKTDWVMQEHWITPKILSTETNEQDIFFLCNVFLVGDKKPNHEKPDEISHLSATSQPTNSVTQKENENSTEKSSTSKPQEFPQMCEVHETRSNVAAREIVPNNNADTVPYIDAISEGDFLEWLDLVNPALPSSSSDSSCMTMSSDECFDALDLLRDIESETKHDVPQDDADCKLRVFESSIPNQVVMNPHTTVTLDKSPAEEMLETRSMPSSAISVKVSDKESENVSKNQERDFRNKEAMPLTSQNQVVSADGKIVARAKKKTLKKYLCFMKF